MQIMTIKIPNHSSPVKPGSVFAFPDRRAAQNLLLHLLLLHHRLLLHRHLLHHLWLLSRWGWHGTTMHHVPSWLFM